MPEILAPIPPGREMAVEQTRGSIMGIPGLGNILNRLSDRHRSGVLGIGWSSLAQIIGLVIKLGSTLVLTRLLAPDAYAILGTAMAVLITLEWMSDLGIHPALVRHPKGESDAYLSTGWLMGLGRGMFMSAMAALSAWPLAMFYGEQSLLGVLLVLSLRPLLMALRSPAYPTLRRNLNYKALCIDEVCMTVVDTACSITMAFVFRDVWAIVLGTMAGALTSVILTYVLCPMRPRLQWDREAATELYSLGKQVFINTIVMAAWLNLDRLLGLRLLSPTEMGLYAIAFNLSSIVEGLITRVCDVYFAMLAREGGDQEKGRWHELICQRATQWGMPVATVAVLLAPWSIWILYDSRYHGAGLVFSMLIARLMVRTIGQLQFQYLLAVAQVRLATYGYLVALAVQVSLFWPLVTQLGVTGMALCILLSTTALTVTQALFLYRRTGRGIRPVVRTLGWSAASLLMMVQFYGNPIVAIRAMEEVAVSADTQEADGSEDQGGTLPADT